MKANQQGMALVVSLSLMVMAIILGVTSMQSSTLDEVAAGNNRAAANALMAAEYGASSIISQIKDNDGFPSDYPDCDESPAFSGPVNISSEQSQDGTVAYYHRVCGSGDVIRISIEGVAGEFERRMSAGVKVDSEESTFTDLAAINFAAPLFGFDAPSSNSFIVEGLIDDKFVGGSLPAITSNGQKSYIEGQIGDGRIDNYVGGISDEIGNSILGDPNLFQQFVQGLKDYAISENRDFDSIDKKSDIGTSGSPKITYVKGDLSMNGNASGAGILIVDGDYGTSGTPYFEGLVIILGDTFGISGGGNGGLSGALITAPMGNVSDEDYEYQSTQVVTNGGGNADYSHDPDALSAAFDLLPESLQYFWQENNTTIFLPPEREIVSWEEVDNFDI